MTALDNMALGISIENSVKQKVVLQLSDEADYDFIFKGGKAPSNNPGRGLILRNEVPIEFQTALIHDEMKIKEENLTF